jgi:glycosyltransferase involved in cell wall biosynthesis
MVLTRDLNTRAGRPALVKNLIETLEQTNDVHVLRLRNVMELKSIASLASVLALWAASLLRLQPLPLQCLLYASPREMARVMSSMCVGEFDTVYLDTVRCQILLRVIRRMVRNITIVSDFDDLMSRRMSLLHKRRLPVMTGHIATSLPAWLRRFVEGPGSRIIRCYEAATLVASELEMISASNAVVLLSHAERLELLRRLPAPLHARVHAIPPVMPLSGPPWAAPVRHRFVFIGSDRLVQNRTAIDLLIEIWRRLCPPTALHIFGAQTRPAQDADGVYWHGFAPDLADVYRPGSIMVLPAVIAGGVKTKVAEAWAYGCPVLGNANAFEGFDVPNYPLDLPESVWDDYILHPERHDALWVAAARAGQDFVAQRLAPEAFDTAWDSLMGSPEGSCLSASDEIPVNPSLPIATLRYGHHPGGL